MFDVTVTQVQILEHLQGETRQNFSTIEQLAEFNKQLTEFKQLTELIEQLTAVDGILRGNDGIKRAVHGNYQAIEGIFRAFRLLTSVAAYCTGEGAEV